LGIISRIATSIASAMRAVSSMRVPVAARKCRRIWPASTVGKKSRPSTGYRKHDTTVNPRKPSAKALRFSNSDASVTV
jgi:hypothetical protein